MFLEWVASVGALIPHPGKINVMLICFIKFSILFIPTFLALDIKLGLRRLRLDFFCPAVCKIQTWNLVVSQESGFDGSFSQSRSRP